MTFQVPFSTWASITATKVPSSAYKVAGPDRGLLLRTRSISGNFGRPLHQTLAVGLGVVRLADLPKAVTVLYRDLRHRPRRYLLHQLARHAHAVRGLMCGNTVHQAHIAVVS